MREVKMKMKRTTELIERKEDDVLTVTLNASQLP